MKAFMDYKERSTVWKTDHVLAVCGGIIRASGLEYIFTRKCPLPLEVLFVASISLTFLPSKKACGAHKFRHF